MEEGEQGQVRINGIEGWMGPKGDTRRDATGRWKRLKKERKEE